MRFFAKLEGQNPTGSVKDRIALAMIEAPSAKASCTPGCTHPRADQRQHRHRRWRCRRQAQGLPVMVVMPENVSVERTAAARGLRRRDRLLGGRSGHQRLDRGGAGAGRRTTRAYVMLYQYGNAANPRAHYETHRPRDPARPARDRRLRGRSGHGRHADGHRALPEGAQADGARSSPRSPTRATSSRACAAWTKASSRRC